MRATGKEGKAEVIDSKTITALFVFWICNTGSLNSYCDANVGKGKRLSTAKQSLLWWALEGFRIRIEFVSKWSCNE